MSKKLIVSVLLAVGSLIAGTLALAGPSAPPAEGPFVLTLELEHEAYAMHDPDTDEPVDWVMTTDEFTWAFASYSDWTFERGCCPDPIDSRTNQVGEAYRATPDGEISYRATRDGEWRPSGSFDPAEGATPIPDLAPAAGETVTVPRRALAIAADLGLEAGELVAYTRAGAIRTYDSVRGIPIHVIEYDDDRLVRELVTTAIEAP